MCARESWEAVHNHTGVTPANFAAVAAEAAVLKSAEPGRRRGLADAHMVLGVVSESYFFGKSLLHFFATFSILITEGQACLGMVGTRPECFKFKK